MRISQQATVVERTVPRGRKRSAKFYRFASFALYFWSFINGVLDDDLEMCHILQYSFHFFSEIYISMYMCNYQQITLIPEVSTFCQECLSQARTKDNFLYKFRLLCCFQLICLTNTAYACITSIQCQFENNKGTDWLSFSLIFVTFYHKRKKEWEWIFYMT